MDEPRKPKRGRPRRLDADKTLDVAMRAYWRDDPADVSINAICKLADVSKPGLYREFGGEDGLMRAVLDRYAEQVLSEIGEILARGAPLTDSLQDLAHFAGVDPKMETGCVFYKMRAGKHRLGPRTLEAVTAIDAAAVDAFSEFLDARRAAGDWTGSHPAPVVARYLVEQIGLALMQRASGEDPKQVQDTLALGFSVVAGTGPSVL
ncbi:MAG: TetR/AcrR family transcriptional regulator [Pseudomonadota bacterium]